MSFHPNEMLRRARLARVMLMVSFVTLGGAFFRTQVLLNDEYKRQSESNRLREVPLPGARGIIYDRNGEIIAENLPGYSVSILSPTEDSLRNALTNMSGFAGVTGSLSCDAFGDCAAQTISIIKHDDPADIAASKANVVYSEAAGVGGASTGASGEIRPGVS